MKRTTENATSVGLIVCFCVNLHAAHGKLFVEKIMITYSFHEGRDILIFEKKRLFTGKSEKLCNIFN